MKNKAFAALAATLALGMAQAQSNSPVENASYGGAIAGLMEVDSSCAPSCDHRGKFGKLYVGTQVAPLLFVEAAIMNLGQSRFNTSTNASLQAASVSLAYRKSFYRQFLTLSGRVGMSYQQVSMKTPAQGANPATEKTTLKLQPLLGLGAEIAITENVNAVASADFSRVKMSDKAVPISAFGLGLSLNFDSK